MTILNGNVKAGNGFGFSLGTFVPPASSPSRSTVLPRRSIDPHSIVHKKLSKAVRAVLAAEILDGNIALLNPTRSMVVSGLGVSSSYVGAASRLTPEQRQEVVCGVRPLVRRKASSVPVNVGQRLAAIVAEVGITAALNMLTTLER
jgi:hypothetical protein